MGDRMTAILVCSGSVREYSYYNKYFDKAQYIIGVDGGASHLRKFGIKPDILIGDFDSVNKEDFEYFKQLGTEIIKFPAEKDMTDTELAIEEASKKGYKNLVLIGAMGTRIDHTLANVFLLKPLLERGIKCIVVDEHNEVELIKDKVKLAKEDNLKVSLIPVSERVEGVTTKGLYYPLNEATLEMGSTWGVSNEFSEDSAEVTIKKGLMLVIKARD
jgi:thiamine pyrophosphokinase